MIVSDQSGKRKARHYAVACAILSITGCGPAVRVSDVEQEVVPREEACEVVMLQQGQHVKPNGEKIGSISIGDTGFSVDCGEQRVTEVLRAQACAAGADAVVVTSWKEPDFWSSCIRAEADFYSFMTTAWPSVSSSREEIVRILDKRSQEGSVHPIEGIWSDKEVEYKIVIIPGAPDGASDFVAVVFESYRYPWWKRLEVKAEIHKTAEPEKFTIKYYRADRSLDDTICTLEEVGLLRIRLNDPGTGGSIDSLWFKEYPSDE